MITSPRLAELLSLERGTMSYTSLSETIALLSRVAFDNPHDLVIVRGADAIRAAYLSESEARRFEADRNNKRSLTYIIA